MSFDSKRAQALRESGQEIWHQLAPGYTRLEDKVTEQATTPMLEAVAAGSGVRLLDLACGPGYATGAGQPSGRTPGE